jgi:NSS family neurotransmitter:Na+ symporter
LERSKTVTKVTQVEATPKRETFSSGIAVFFATLGSAVGIGNIWKFPYLTGANGGAAFLFVYLFCILFVGIPIMIGEFYIGRKTRKNAVGAFSQLKSGSRWKLVGYVNMFATYLVMFFYTCVAGWVYSYVFKAFKGDFVAVTPELTKDIFGKTVVGPVPPIVWQVVVLFVIATILIMGVKNGIEKITKTLMPVLFVLIIVCCIRALTLIGAAEGLKFLFKPDFSKLTAAAILTALGLAFFKLSLAMGAMITYGSYFTKDNNLMTTSVKVALSDTLVSVLAGIAIFPVVFTFNIEPGAGPGLLFMTIPLVFSKLPLGNILLIGFFILTSIAATTAMISLLEVTVAYWVEERKVSRTKAVITNCLIIFAFGLLATLSVDKSSLLGGISIFGKGFFDLFDYVSSNIMLPIGGLLIALFVGYFINKDELKYELSNENSLKIDKAFNLFYFVLRYITPVLLVVVFLNSVGLIKF